MGFLGGDAEPQLNHPLILTSGTPHFLGPEYTGPGASAFCLLAYLWVLPSWTYAPVLNRTCEIMGEINVVHVMCGFNAVSLEST